MKTPVKIGEQNFVSKKNALLYYKNILNFYKFGQSLNDNDFVDLMALLNYEYQFRAAQTLHIENFDEEVADSETLFVENIIVSKVQFNTKCFEVFYNDNTSCYILYLMIINRKEYTPEILFVTACRNCIQKDLMRVKQEYFKKYSIRGNVKCQETNKLSRWEELVVDHRQPNTLSIIIDRFKEVCNIQVSELEYTSTRDNLIVFKDQALVQEFISYHQSKATLRIVKKELNASRSAMGRVKRSSRDLTIDQNQLPLF